MKHISFILLSLFNSIIILGQNGGLIESESYKIYYETFGEGDPLLIINGGPGMNSKGFRTIGSLLSKNYKTIIYDQRGTGNSILNSISGETITMDLMIEDIEKLRAHLQLDTWNVMGHSFGGILASYYASKHPNKINKLILSASGGLDLELLNYVGQNINSKLSASEKLQLQVWSNKIAEGDTTYQARLNRGKTLAPAYLFNKTYIPIIAERLTQGNTLINMLVFQDLRKIQYDCKNSLSSFKKPVLIIQGKQDIIDKKTALKAHETFPNSELVLLDECGHYGWLDKKEEYLSTIFTFLEIH